MFRIYDTFKVKIRGNKASKKYLISLYWIKGRRIQGGDTSSTCTFLYLSLCTYALNFVYNDVFSVLMKMSKAIKEVRETCRLLQHIRMGVVTRAMANLSK